MNYFDGLKCIHTMSDHISNIFFSIFADEVVL